MAKKTKQRAALDRAVEIVGSAAALARAIGARSPALVTNWRMRGSVPAEQCPAIERATSGAVTRHDLRPDLFDPPAERAA